MGPAPVFFFFFFFFRQLTPRDAPPCVCSPLPLFDLIAVPFPSSFILFRCVTHSLSLSLPCLPIWVVFHCLYMYMVAFLVLRKLYVVALVYFAFVSCFFSPEFLPGDDVLCRLLSRRILLSAFFPVCLSYFILFFPTLFVPDVFWWNFLYLVTTAGFVADQLNVR